MDWVMEVQLSCYQLIAKPGNKTAVPPWPDPYVKDLSHIEIELRGSKDW